MFATCMFACDRNVSKNAEDSIEFHKTEFQCIDNMSYAVSINGSFAQIKDSIGRYKTCDTLVEVDWSKMPAKYGRDRKGRPLLWPDEAPSTQSTSRLPGESMSAWRKRLEAYDSRLPGESMSAWRKRLEAYDKETPKVPKVGAKNAQGQVWTGKRWL